MKKYITIIIATLLLVASCTPFSEMSDSRQLRESMRQENVTKAIESQHYKIEVNKLYTRRGVPLDLKPTNNYIIVSNDRARINLAYVGRSYDIRRIAAINLTGQVIEKDIRYKKKGQMVLNLKVQQKNDTFRVNIHVSASGYCNVNITHPRIDNISYRGTISTIG